MNVKLPLALVSLALAGSAALLAATATDDDQVPDRAEGRAEAQAALRPILAPGDTGLSYHRAYAGLQDFLPNVEFGDRRHPDRERAVDSVVVGRVVGFAADRGFVHLGRPGKAGQPNARITDFDDQSAHWRTMKVTVNVESVVAGRRTDTLVLDLPLTGNEQHGEDMDAAGEALKELGRIVVFSKALPADPVYLGQGRVLADEPYSIATVGSNEDLWFPFADAEEWKSARDFMGGIDTVGELRSEAAKGRRTVYANE